MGFMGMVPDVVKQAKASDGVAVKISRGGQASELQLGGSKKKTRP